MPAPAASPTDQVMYHLTCRALPLKEQMRCAQLAGCAALTTGAYEYFTHLTKGLSTRDMKSMAADHNLRFEQLDPIACWIDGWRPEGLPEILNIVEDDFFRAVDGLEAKVCTAISMWGNGVYPMSKVIDEFGRFCARAAKHGLKVNLEFIPMGGGVETLEQAWEIVSKVNAANSGIVVDMWHYHRGKPDDALLRKIPGKWIGAVQLNDNTAKLPDGVTLFEDTLFRRLPPGEGAFRIKEIVGILRETGGLNYVGPEILSAEFDKLNAEQIAAKCKASTAWALG